MKVTVSYINSKDDLTTTLKNINYSSADNIHADLMDGIYVPTKNFTIEDLKVRYRHLEKEIDFHLMVMNPEKYLDTILKLNSNIIFIHPSTSKDPVKLIEYIKANDKMVGIAINPDEEVKDFFKYLDIIDAVLIMSVTPGKGGQKFMKESLINYELIKEQKKNYLFYLYVDGGINDETVKYIKDADGIVVGSFICNSDDYEVQIKKLKNVK